MQRRESGSGSLLARPVAKAFIAVTLHRPGLRFLCGAKFPAAVRRLNAVVLSMTAVAMAAGGILAPEDHRLMTVLVVWGAAHLLWGLYLAHLVARP